MDREALLQRIESDERLDAAAGALSPLARAVQGRGARRDLLSGTWLGHPAHPSLVLAPLGFFFSASTLDLLGGRASRRAARRLLGLGIVTAVPAAAAGLNDWADTGGAERRVGLVHASANTAALLLYGASWRQRGRGRHGRGVAMALAGTTLSGLAGYLGGHLSYRRGVGVDTTTFSSGPSDWRPLGPVDRFPIDEPAPAVVDDVPLLVVRTATGAQVLEARCTHRGGPLNEGEVADGCVTCPWHGSVFDLSTGAVERGPASAPAPRYDTRISAGVLEVRREEPGVLRRLSLAAGEPAG